MAYGVANPPKCLVPGMGGAPALWYYADADAHGTITADDYFSNGDALGMKFGDIVLVSSNTSQADSTVHAVRTQVTVGAASITAAELG